MIPLITLDHVRSAVDLHDFDSRAALQRMAPAPRGWQSARLSPTPGRDHDTHLLYPGPDGILQIALTLRAAELRGHSGQVSFPGGRPDPGDENLTATARRETFDLRKLASLFDVASDCLFSGISR